jgi:hypothetical protein
MRLSLQRWTLMPYAIATSCVQPLSIMRCVAHHMTTACFRACRFPCTDERMPAGVCLRAQRASRGVRDVSRGAQFQSIPRLAGTRPPWRAPSRRGCDTCVRRSALYARGRARTRRRPSKNACCLSCRRMLKSRGHASPIGARLDTSGSAHLRRLTCARRRSSMREEYMPAMRLALTSPMWGVAAGGREKDGIPAVMQLMDDYCLTRCGKPSMQRHLVAC